METFLLLGNMSPSLVLPFCETWWLLGGGAHFALLARPLATLLAHGKMQGRLSVRDANRNMEAISSSEICYMRFFCGNMGNNFRSCSHLGWRNWKITPLSMGTVRVIHEYSTSEFCKGNKWVIELRCIPQDRLDRSWVWGYNLLQNGKTILFIRVFLN